MRPGTSNI